MENTIELLAPAGDLERLKIALTYGADAVYIGGQTFGLRASAKNFSFEDMEEGIKFAHDMGKKVYITINIIPHNEDLTALPQYLQKLKDLKADALILSDPGTYMMVRQYLPHMEIHLSTQANTTNYMSANFWYQQGIKRIVLARELSLSEIKETVEKTSPELEYEIFIHGAMCISYSGRCLLSNYMIGRDANRGECAHPCRWKYHLVEEKRPGEYMPIHEDEKGTYVYNSKDLCMIGHIPQLINSGVSSLKIEGRMKSSYYVATIVKAYRKAIDTYYQLKNKYEFKEEWLEEIKKASHREFTTGFYFDKPGPEEQLYSTSSYVRNYDFVGLVLDYDPSTSMATVEQRNRIFVNDQVEIIGPQLDSYNTSITEMWDKDGSEIHVAPHAQQILKIKVDIPLEKYSMLRKKRS